MSDDERLNAHGAINDLSHGGSSSIERSNDSCERSWDCVPPLREFVAKNP